MSLDHLVYITKMSRFLDLVTICNDELTLKERELLGLANFGSESCCELNEGSCGSFIQGKGCIKHVFAS